MRKSAVAICLLLLALAAYLLLNRSVPPGPTPQNRADENSTPEGAATAPMNSSTRPKWNRPAHVQDGAQDNNTASKAIVYGPQEFSRGELQNVVIDGGIKLGDNPSFVPRFNPKYRLFGNYISPEEELHTPFNAASINFQVSALNNNEATFEIRTRGTDGAWSEWREVSPQSMKEPVSFGSNAMAWQFRVTLFANDAASSPKVETVAIEPLSSAP